MSCLFGCWQGKDFVAERLAARLEKQCANHPVKLIHISEPIKKRFAQLRGSEVDAERLLDASPYKEKFRREMIEWSDAQKREDPRIFCRIAAEWALNGTNHANSSAPSVLLNPIWIIVDCRRPDEMAYFENAGVVVVTVRITADEATRRFRGWIHVDGVDDVARWCLY